MDSPLSFRRQPSSSTVLSEALTSSPKGFTVCPHVFVSSWTSEELHQRQSLYMKAFQKAQRMAAFLPDERIAFL
jgi:hypothetical protein